MAGIKRDLTRPGLTCDHCGKNLVLKLGEYDRITGIEPYYSVMWNLNLGGGKSSPPKSRTTKYFKFCPECFSVLDMTLNEFGFRHKEG